MAKKTDALAKVAANVKGFGSVAAVIGVVSPLVEPVVDIAKDKIKERRELLTVPSLCSKGFPIPKEQAVEVLSQIGFVPVPSELPIYEAKPKYRNCDCFQVIKTDPPKGKKLAKGQSVVVSYITQKVIDESKRLFEEEQARKADEKAEREKKRADQQELNKKRVNEIKGKLKSGAEKLAPKHNKKSKENDNEQRE